MKTRSYIPNSVKLTAGGLGLVLAAHFTLTILHVAPVNPLKVEQERVVNAWVEPLFVQNWQLFAPDPIAHDQGLLVRARLSGGAGPTETDFVDITTPHLQQRHHNLLPQRTNYTVSGVIHKYLDARESVVDSLPADQREAAPFSLGPTELDQASESDKGAYVAALGDLRDAAVHSLPPQQGDVQEVQMRLVTHEFPRYSDRFNRGVGGILHATTEWQPVSGEPQP